MYNHSSSTNGYGCVEAYASEQTNLYNPNFIGDFLKVHMHFKAYFPNREHSGTYTHTYDQVGICHVLLNYVLCVCMESIIVMLPTHT